MKAAILRSLAKKREERQSTAKIFYSELSSGVSAGAPASVVAAATEAFSMPGAAMAAAQARPGATQLGEPFVPPSATTGGHLGPPSGSSAAGFAPPQGPGGDPSAGYPGAGAHPYSTPAAQAIPAPPPLQRSGGGGTGVLGRILLAGFVVACLVGGGLWYVGSRGDDDEITAADTTTATATATATATTAEAATSDSTAAAPPSDTGTASAAPNDSASAEADEPVPTRQPSAPPVSNPTAPAPTSTGAPPASGCDEAIGHAMAGRCGAAQSAMSRCSGPKQSTARANLSVHCRGGHGPLRRKR
jgi:serine/threonine-protein kinase